MKEIEIAVAVIKDKEGRTFFQRRFEPEVPEANGKWDFPGGKLEINESPEDAVKRECLEEIGCEIAVIGNFRLKTEKEWVKKDGASFKVHINFLEGRIVNGIPYPKDRKVSEVGWFAKKDFPRDVLDTLAPVLEMI